MKDSTRYLLAQHVGGGVLHAMLSTVRWRVENAERYQRHTQAGEAVIFVCWHGRLLPLGYVHRHQNIAALASRSADGEYIARLLQRWGYHMIRGSSSSGGDTAFREMIRTVRGGRSMAVTPDGPRGPRQHVKPGVIQLAQITGAPLIPVAAAAERAWWFESWDRFLVPQPFARAHVAYGHAITVPRGATSSRLEAIRGAVEERLNTLLARVEQQAAG